MDLDHTKLDQFLFRILELHKSEVISDFDAVTAIAEVVAQAANGNPNLNEHMKLVLEDSMKGDH